MNKFQCTHGTYSTLVRTIEMQSKRQNEQKKEEYMLVKYQKLNAKTLILQMTINKSQTSLTYIGKEGGAMVEQWSKLNSCNIKRLQ